MSVCSTKTRTAALSVRTRWHPGPWCGSRRPVRSISANSLPIVVWRSIVISRNCSQNSGSTVIDVSRPLILTWCRQLSFQRCLSHCWRRHLTSDSQSEMATRACRFGIPSDAGSFGHISEFPNQFFCDSRVVGFWRAFRRPGKRLRGSAFPNVNLANKSRSARPGNVPTWARKAGCSIRSEALGTDYDAGV
jgi:hypothetical protein